MKNFLVSKYFLLLVFAILIIIRGIKGEGKEPPKTLQIGTDLFFP